MTPIKKKFRDFIYCFKPLPEYYGKEFKKIYAFLNESRNWSREQMKAYKLMKLRQLLSHAQVQVPYYRELFKKHGIIPEDIMTFRDYSKLPILTKKTLQQNPDRLKADNFASFHPIPGATSGTSAGSTKFYRSSYQEAFRKAVLWRIFNEYGYAFRQKRATITNPSSFDPDSPVYEYDRIENELIINTSHLMAQRFEESYKAIQRFKPAFIWAHANMLGLLAEYTLRNNLLPFDIPLIGTYAIKFEPHVRRLVEKVFRGRYFEYYGNRENTIAAWGDNNQKFFEVSEYCHLEVDTRASGGKKDEGDLITTSLHNYAFPLIRYHSEDYVRWLDYIDDDIPYPALKLIGGRGRDMIVTRNGLVESYVLINMEKKGFDKIQSFQFEQLSLDELVFRVVPKPEYARERDEKTMITLIEKALPCKFEIEVKYVDSIPPTPQGKFRWVISPLALDYVDQYES
ncbi:MAG: phenylacetate--CoA ligase family protein [candidate division Zixibacteria bacterium]|nr:phenylacetate--CoA ligase family protein [candidate division Zixibacteria bacterium]NIR64630.1 phenylacetate--CoA ligase family protein [candidate division Zixibacteria bacterium]NIS16799.1 phenylacetate--CoA ligase family protein [candidate division Zixibacteria bacterium]NIS46489.1 phenylacetate--CoA ligase family protein [candidate division Zixibacteria bacterium]NIT53212.1 phenylacetate--CoA ligase family protein [candidate division Zixibacteria bacterium]